MGKKIYTQVRLDPEQKTNLEALSEATGRSQQKLMREAIVRYLGNKKAQISMGKKIIAAREEIRKGE
jgi:predicted DNA-binding protein